MRTNRKGFPNELKSVAKKGLGERGKAEVRQNGNLTVSVWQDSKPVTILATNADPTKSESVQRKTKDGTRITVPSLQSIVLYNMFRGGVDLNDQLRGYYHLRLKGRKFYKYIVFFLIDLTITNYQYGRYWYIGMARVPHMRNTNMHGEISAKTERLVVKGCYYHYSAVSLSNKPKNLTRNHR